MALETSCLESRSSNSINSSPSTISGCKPGYSFSIYVLCKSENISRTIP